ncbi:hypothetical protein CDD81_4934 [Ophiocordyceps australis]|uniref:Dipeptidyl-peptidase V n=1 Tax=Ophiocordyceps australis TaxID=1399860 RepID=A0A2C5Y659_9HYPO|nr:hypothetical protein CDD81_4934 [Ophiocordyceps australis]
MTIQAARFTPEVLLSAPRRSSAAPNPTGDWILYTVSSYSFDKHVKTSSIRVLNVKDGSSRILCQDAAASEPVWIGDYDVLYVKSGDNGSCQLMAQHLEQSEPQVVHALSGTLSSLKTKRLSRDQTALCGAALTTPKGDLNQPSETKPHSTARIYTSLYVRHWDTWETENKNSLWYGQLTKHDGKWKLDGPGLTNLLAGSGLSSPVPPFGGTGDFDLSDQAICFVAKDPELNPARYTKTDLYYVPLKSYADKPGTPRRVETGKLCGYSIAPVFSHSGKQIAFARMKHVQYEADKARLMLIGDVEDLSNVQEFYQTENGKGGWDRNPEWIGWSQDDKELFVTAEEEARVKLWKLPSSPLHAKQLPEAIHGDGSVGDAKLLGNSRNLLITVKSLVESSLYAILDPSTNKVTEVSSSSKNGKSFGLDRSQCGEIWYPGSAGYKNHALVVKPSTFDESKRYPLAFLIHGGPQSAWTDDWSTRWNPAIYAEQGYVVVCPNPTGSTGYGQDHVDAIRCNWGGNPYQDLVKCFDYLEKEVKYIDTKCAVALGASYGGYMINWIQGHELGRRFKALVCHDGVFSTQNQWSTEELFFPEHDFGGTLWDNRKMYARWDPSLHLDNWATPQLVIHNELDYRLPIAEGLAMFNVLQARKVPSKYIVFPDENHWVLKPENSLVWHRQVLGWINKYSGVGGEDEV